MSEDDKDWVMTRRFFIFDTISGVEGDNGLQNLENINDNGERNKQIKVVRYAKNMTLNIQLDMSADRPEAIYVPYLEIDYEEKATDAIIEEDGAKLKKIFFISEYTMEDSGFWKLARWTFWILFVIMIIIFTLVTYVYMGQEKQA